jgi:hypothetical protein
MTFERDSRVSQMRFPLWWMEIGDPKEHVKRRLIIEPYMIAGMHAELHAWVEDDTPQYCYVVKSFGEEPEGPPSFRVEAVINEKSRRTIRAKTGLEYIVIGALATDQLTSDSAKGAVHNLFWTHFVLDDDGLSWLCKYATKDTGNFYANQRLRTYVEVSDDRNPEAYGARNAVEDCMKHDRELGARMQLRVNEDAAFQHAIEALLMTNEEVEIKHANIQRLVELNATDKDRVFASIVAASYDHALRGLRACQRAERDPEFFEAIAAIARRETNPAARSKCINAFLHKSRMKP